LCINPCKSCISGYFGGKQGGKEVRIKTLKNLETVVCRTYLQNTNAAGILETKKMQFGVVNICKKVNALRKASGKMNTITQVRVGFKF
jgi:hypothetical protein